MNNYNLSKKIKLLRESHNISQIKISEYLNINSNLLSKIENNEIKITTDLLDKISSLFCISCETLLSNESDDMFINQDYNNIDLNTISNINKIILNLQFMEDISEK